MGQNGQKATGKASAASDAACDAFLENVSGFEIVRLLPYSPAHDAGLVPYFDFIVGMDGVFFSNWPSSLSAAAPQSHPSAPSAPPLSSPAAEASPATDATPSNNNSSNDNAPRATSAELFAHFKNRLRESENGELPLLVFNLRVRVVREVRLRPNREWPRRLPSTRVAVGGSLLGCSLEWARAADRAGACFRIQAIMEGSPAARCPALKEGRDFVLGVQAADEGTGGVPIAALMRSLDDFSRRVAQWQEHRRAQRQQPLQPGVPPPALSLLLLVFDSEAGEVREVPLAMPDADSPLGMQLASGLLHRVPAVEWEPHRSPYRLEELLPQMTQFVFDPEMGPLAVPRRASDAVEVCYVPAPVARAPAPPAPPQVSGAPSADSESTPYIPPLPPVAPSQQLPQQQQQQQQQQQPQPPDEPHYEEAHENPFHRLGAPPTSSSSANVSTATAAAAAPEPSGPPPAPAGAPASVSVSTASSDVVVPAASTTTSARDNSSAYSAISEHGPHQAPPATEAAAAASTAAAGVVMPASSLPDAAAAAAATNTSPTSSLGNSPAGVTGVRAPTALVGRPPQAAWEPLPPPETPAREMPVNTSPNSASTAAAIAGAPTVIAAPPQHPDTGAYYMSNVPTTTASYPPTSMQTPHRATGAASAAAHVPTPLAFPSFQDVLRATPRR